MAKSKRGHGRKWTAEETALLKELYPTSPIPELAQRFGRSVASVKAHAYLLGLKRRSWCQKLWTAEELQMLRELYPSCESTRELAEKIGRPWGSVRQIASNLGITKGSRRIDFGEL